MPPKFDPNAVIVIYMRAVGGEAGNPSALGEYSEVLVARRMRA